MRHDMRLFKDGCAAMNIPLDENQLLRMEQYLSLILEWNQKFNLTAITDPDEIQVHHFLDSVSLLLLNGFREGGLVLDVGTGAGFPGIPVKILRPDLSLTLMDSVQKKVGFLNEAINCLGLTNTEAIHARAEDLSRKAERREACDIVVSRAVAELSVLAEYCLPFVKVGGYFIAHKGPGADIELEKALRAISLLGGKWIETRNIKIPFSEKNHKLVVVEKIRNTPGKYPRKAGIPKKSPL
jgi:16S rRNA (guanine527-N7)-methyltransferase